MICPPTVPEWLMIGNILKVLWFEVPVVTEKNTLFSTKLSIFSQSEEEITYVGIKWSFSPTKTWVNPGKYHLIGCRNKMISLDGYR